MNTVLRMNIDNYKKVFKDFDVIVIDNIRYNIYVNDKNGNPIVKIGYSLFNDKGTIDINDTDTRTYNKLINLIYGNAKYFRGFMILDYHKRIKIKEFIPME